MPFRLKRLPPFAAVALLFATPADAHDVASPKWTPWLELGGFYGSRDTSRGEAALWVPLAQSNTTVLFGEARGKLFEDDMREGNFALGYRQMMPGGWNFGIWGGYDIRESAFSNTFHQLAGGIEALSDRWDFRANAYLPVNDSESVFAGTALASSSAIEFTGTTIGMITTITSTSTRIEEVALWGFDAEIGAKLYATPEDLAGPRHELRLYAGAYHFDHSDLPDSVTGPRVRAEWRMDEIIDQWAGSRLTFEAEYSYDKLRDDRVEVGARLRLPFGESGARIASRSLSAQERRMSEGLERDTDIVTSTTAQSATSTSTITEGVKDAHTGVEFHKVATVDGATGSITDAANAEGDNTLIIATGDFTGFHQIQSNQTLQGGGSTIQIEGVTSGTVLDFTATGTRAKISTSDQTQQGSLLFLNGSNVHVAGIDAVGPTATDGDTIDGVSGATGITNVLIEDVNVSDLSGTGFSIPHQATNVTVRGVTATNISMRPGTLTGNFSGISIGSGSSDVHISNFTIAGALLESLSATTVSSRSIPGTLSANRDRPSVSRSSTIPTRSSTT